MQLTNLKILLAVSTLLITRVQSQDDSTTICIWSELRAASIRGALYLDGGMMFKSYPGQPPTQYFGNSTSLESVLYSLNYSTAFDLKISNLTDIFTEVEEGGVKQVPPMYNGYMFADDFELYTYGGLDNPDVVNPPPTNYAFGWQIYEDTPGVVISELGANPVALPADVLTRYTTNGAGVNVPSEKLAFYFSGMTNDPTDYDGLSQTGWTAVDQLIGVDMSTFGSPKWSNNSFNNPNIQPRADAELVWIPVGTKGALIVIGGVINPEELFKEDLSMDQIGASQKTSPSFMQFLPVYDIANAVWYLQEATGPYPGQLTQFCSVVANETGSYDIYIYGGYDGLQGAGIGSPKPPSDDVWVLSVPSFVWTKVHSGNSANGRRGHYCTAPYPEQMFVVGGVGTYPDTSLTGTIIQVFNLNTLTWQDKYDPTVYSKKGYQRPNLVANAIKKQPIATWTETAIGDLFDTPYAGKIGVWFPYPSTSSTNHHAPVGAIAGAVASGVCLIVLILAILWYRRKHSKKSRERGDSEIQPYEQVSRWRRGVAKTDPSVTTTEVDDGSAINPSTGGYYKPVEAPGDEGFHQHSPASPRPGGFAEAGGGTRRISAGQTISPRSPRSPQSGSRGAQEVDGEERYEMEVMQSHRGSGDSGTRHRFRDHPLYPLSVSDGDGKSHTSGPSYSGPNHSQSPASHTDASRGVPSPYLIARPSSGMEDAELPASPVRPTHVRNISSISSGTSPQVSPPLEQANLNPITVAHPEDDLDALEAFHTGSPQPRYRPSHTRNLSSMSSGINQLPTPSEELNDAEQHRQSTLIAKLPSPTDGTTPIAEEQNPLMGNEATSSDTGATKGGDTVYSPSSYSKGSTPMSNRSPVTRKPVGQVLGIERAFSSHEGISGERPTL